MCRALIGTQYKLAAPSSSSPGHVRSSRFPPPPDVEDKVQASSGVRAPCLRCAPLAHHPSSGPLRAKIRSNPPSVHWSPRSASPTRAAVGRSSARALPGLSWPDPACRRRYRSSLVYPLDGDANEARRTGCPSTQAWSAPPGPPAPAVLTAGRGDRVHTHARTPRPSANLARPGGARAPEPHDGPAGDPRAFSGPA